MKTWLLLFSAVVALVAPARQADGGGTDTENRAALKEFRAELQAYVQQSPAEGPEEAARGWLNLFDQEVKLPAALFADQLDPARGMPHRFSELTLALPPPSAWESLAAQVHARPLPPARSDDLNTPVLWIVAGLLQQRPEMVWQARDRLYAQIGHVAKVCRDPVRGGFDYPVIDNFDVLDDTLNHLFGNDQKALADFEAKIALIRADARAKTVSSFATRRRGLQVPDLVRLVGPARAEALLKEVFALKIDGASFTGTATKQLATQVATETKPLRFAPWSLADSLEGGALFDRLEKQFPPARGKTAEEEEAERDHILSLATHGHVDAAVTRVVKLCADHKDEDAFDLDEMKTTLDDLAYRGHAIEIYAFFNKLTSFMPRGPYWETLMQSAVLAGKTETGLAALKAASERHDLKADRKEELQIAYREALLTAGHLDEALQNLRATMTQADAQGASSDDARLAGANAAVHLATIGYLTEDNALVAEGVASIFRQVTAAPQLFGRLSVPTDVTMADLFLRARRGPNLEHIIKLALARDIAVSDSRWDDHTADPAHTASAIVRPMQNKLVALVDLYDKTGRYQDIVDLLDQSKWWGVEDIGDLPVFGTQCCNPGIGPELANALQESGHTQAALQMVETILYNEPGKDLAYQVLLKILPPAQAEARLSEIATQHPFEERPFIWRASLLLKQGRVDEAEKSARQAIAIDPSDGDQGSGDRFRAYAVLADILDRKGEKETAAELRRAVHAIRLAEQADLLQDAHLLPRAVQVYTDALHEFPNAHCIESRLAMGLAALGRFDEASPHYERAFALMPQSYGRAETHCVGCADVLATDRARAIADDVFKNLEHAQPENPRVHYLLGTLRRAQLQWQEAADEFRAAARLDPDYLNAWSGLSVATTDPATQNEALLQVLRLDSWQGIRFSTYLPDIGDARALWNAVAAAKKPAPPPLAVYPLAASTAFINEERGRFPTDESLLPTEHTEPSWPTPTVAVTENSGIAAAFHLLRSLDDPSSQSGVASTR